MGEYGIVGDPAGMRALADQLVAYAGVLGTAKSDVKKGYGKADMAGPLADLCQESLRYSGAGFGTASDILDAVAKNLRSAADTVEDQIEAERRRRERAAREAEEAQQRARRGSSG